MRNENTEDTWNNVYSNFKGKRFSIWKIKATPWFVQKIPFLKKKGVKKILDAGCGDGRNLNEFAHAGFEMTGIDMSEKGVEKSKRVKKKFPKTKIEQMDLEKMDFKNKFDAIVCDYVFVHVNNEKKVIGNFYKALKKNGLALLEFISIYDTYYGLGKKLTSNTYLYKNVLYRGYSIDYIYKILKKFDILSVDQITHEDPSHSGYIRAKPHFHNSFYVLARKK